ETFHLKEELAAYGVGLKTYGFARWLKQDYAAIPAHLIESSPPALPEAPAAAELPAPSSYQPRPMAK
ncbi:hypothetical protein ABZ352_39350, partial [Streptomyces griseofuscus]|uniref:hypothetical protein n=1 Tax=Streptomyces griseofuscus TaxID=146922 RepID=UPI0033DAC279